VTRSQTAGGTRPGPPVLVETSRQLPLVTVVVGQRSGAATDLPTKAGLTRLVTRLMRRTGGGMDPDELDMRVDSLGASLSADVMHSAVTFHGTVIARSLEPFVDLLVEVLARPGFAEDEIERQKREVRSELLDALDNDRALVRRFFERSVFKRHPFGHPVNGTVRTVEAISRDDLLAHYRRTWQARNLVFAFAGDIDESQASRIAMRVADALADEDPPADDVPEPDAPQGRKLVLVDKPERTQTQILLGGLGTHPHDDDHIPLHVGNTIFGGTFSARMTRQIRSERGWSYGAYSSLPIDRRRRSFSMWTFPKAADAAPCIRLQLEMLKHWRQQGVTADELKWAKNYLVRSHAFAIDTAAKRVALALDEVLYDLPKGYYDRYTERVEAVTVEQVNAAVRRRIPESNLLVTVVGTEPEIGAAVRNAIDGLDTVETVPFDADP
jgi:zinc protease